MIPIDNIIIYRSKWYKNIFLSSSVLWTDRRISIRFEERLRRQAISESGNRVIHRLEGMVRKTGRRSQWRSSSEISVSVTKQWTLWRWIDQKMDWKTLRTIITRLLAQELYNICYQIECIDRFVVSAWLLGADTQPLILSLSHTRSAFFRSYFTIFQFRPKRQHR